MQLKRASFIFDNGVKLELHTGILNDLTSTTRDELWLVGSDGQVVHFLPREDWYCKAAKEKRRMFIRNCTGHCMDLAIVSSKGTTKNQIQSTINTCFDLMAIGFDLFVVTNRSK